MSGPEEETYSIMFASLKHPARRKILRMLSIKPKTFSRILDELSITSSHLTYHLEHLGELVSKNEDGTYNLSVVGEAAVTTMRAVEEVPITLPKYSLGFSLKWKSLFAVFMIGLVVLSGFSYTQFISLNHLSSDYDQLVTDFDRVSDEREKLMAWSVSTDRALTFLEDVIQLDMTKYHARLVSNTVEYRSDLGGVTEELLKYTLTSYQSELDVDFKFRNQTLNRYRLDILEGSPLYAKTQPTNALETINDLFLRYQNYAGVSYLQEMNDILKTVNELEETEIIVDELKLILIPEGNDVEIQWIRSTSGIDYEAKGLRFSFDDGVLEMLLDGWYLFNVGSTELDVSEQEAINIALNYARDFSWSVDGVEVTDFIILEESAVAGMHPHSREEPLSLIPYWYVTFYLDKVYPGNVNRIAVGVWADTAEITNVQTLG